MKPSKKQALEKAGWRVGSTSDFLELTKEETAYIDMKLALADTLRKQRSKKKLSQVQVAELLASSQSRVAKMEAADATVSLDLLVKSLLALGTSKKALATAIQA